jgi:dephospho-CoA kinase
MLTIGLTGGIGSGKSTVAQAFEARGITVIDADAIAHALTAPGGDAINAIRDAFGATFITPEGALDRAQMRTHVFAQPAARLLLESILHPRIRAETAQRASAARSAYLILMIPLLVEARTRDANWRQRYDRVLVIDCSEATQISRVMSRSGLTEAAVQAIMANQASRQERLAEADDVINNDGSADAIAPQVEVLHRRYLLLADSA